MEQLWSKCQKKINGSKCGTIDVSFSKLRPNILGQLCGVFEVLLAIVKNEGSLHIVAVLFFLLNFLQLTACGFLISVPHLKIQPLFLLSGIKLVFESEEEEWGRKDNVIGCGFDPKQKKVFFTLDSKMVRVVHCKSEEFGSPLYPILAANTHTTVLVNMGQSEFKYEPANAQRTANPCFIHPPRDYSLGDDMGYEDSRDLFSMTFDSQWLNTCTIKGTPTATSKRAKGFDEEAAEVELYEIALGESGRISSTAAQ